MMDTSRIYFEHPPAFAAIQTTHSPKKINGYSSITPAKAKKSWGDLLRIPGRSKKNPQNGILNHNNSYPTPANLPAMSPYSPDSRLSNSNVTVMQYDPYGREYFATYGSHFGGYNTTYSRASISPAVNNGDHRLKKGLENKAMSYTDWFGTVVSKSSPARPRINSTSSPFYLPENSASPTWDGLGSVRSPTAVIPATIPIQLYSNLCLCPEQLYSTKSKSRKKCKKCGCKIATIRNATALCSSKVRPVIPPNFYQPPNISWRIPSPTPIQSQYALPINHKEGKSTFSPLEEVDEYESPPRTPETIKSVRSTLSNDSNVTLTKSRIRQPKIIPHPPKLPLPPVPEAAKSKSSNKRTSIIEETPTAYELMNYTDNDQEISDSDDLSDNVINKSYESRIGEVSSFLDRSDLKNTVTNNKDRYKSNTHNAYSTEDLSKIRRHNFTDIFSDAKTSAIVKFRSKSSSNITNNLDLTNNKKNIYHSPNKPLTSNSKRINDNQYETKIKRYSDIPDLKKSINLQNSFSQNTMISKASSHQSLQNSKTSPQKNLLNKPRTRPIPPQRDASKLVSIAGQRILFDKGTSPSKNNLDNYNHKMKSFSDLKTDASIDAWDNISECSDYKFDNEKVLDNTIVTSLREPNESNVNQILKPFTKRRQFCKDPKSTFYGNGFDLTIKEEDELEEHENGCKIPTTETDLYTGPVYEESDISSVSDSSPERNSRFQTSLSDLLHVKSILKRPNSVDTSSENDSDFYLPTFSEYKQMQKKKKSVQFLHSFSANSLIENEKELHKQSDNELFCQSTEANGKLENGICEGQTPINTEPKTESNHLKSTDSMETQHEKLSDNSKGLYHRLEDDQMIDLKGKNTSKGSSSKIPTSHHPSAANRVPKKTSSSSHLVTIPNRPSVPPPPPPPPPALPGAQKKTLNSEFSSISRSNIYDLNSISCENVDEHDDETQSNSSQCSTPPPLPSSSPPLLDGEECMPVQIFANINENESMNNISFEKAGFLRKSFFDDSNPSMPASKIPALANGIICQSVNYQENKRPTVTSESSMAKSKFKSKGSKIPRIGVSSIQTSPLRNVSNRNVVSVDKEADEHFTDHIYEELRSITSSPCSNERSLSPEKSIFDGASKYEILEFLRNARKRVKMDDEDDEMLSETLRNEMEVLTLEDDECRVRIEPQDDMILSSIYRDGRSSNRSSNSDSSENSALLRSDKERLLTGEIERTDSGVGSETSKPTITVRQQATASHFDTNGVSPAFRERNLPPCDDCDFPVEAKVSNGGLMYAPLVCHRCSRRRQERKEILMEIIETEVKYGRDLRVMMDQFYKPMQVAGLLTQEQLRRIFINIEELVDHNRQFALQIKDAYEIALDQGDEGFLSVNVGKLFLQASSMLHSFQSYCVRQSEASFYLQNLERDRELLRIFLRVSQMENTLLRRMNLHSFLMVPVQRITKYPLLLSRLYKTTPPSHSSREDCRKAREKIELFLQHINNESKGSSSTKLWRRISMSVGGGNAPPKRSSQPPDYDTSLKMRAVALEVLDWNNDEATVVREGRLLCLPPDSGNWTRRGRGIKMASVQVALITLGRPIATLEEKIPENGLITPKNIGIKEAAILAFKDHRLSKSALIREPWLLSKVVLSWDSEGETESFEITDMITKETFIFRDRDSVSTEEWFRSAQFHALSVGTWRLRRPALANIMINGARS